MSASAIAMSPPTGPSVSCAAGGVATSIGIPSAVSADLLQPPAAVQRHILIALVGLIFVAIAWAGFARVEEVTKGQGRVIPASKIQLVQNLEGGIVREVLVREGTIVKEGQVIARIDPTIAGSSLGEAREKMLALEAMVARLEAEVENKPLTFGRDLALKRPDLIAAQTEQHEVRKRELAAALSGLELLERQRGQEILELEAKIETLKRSSALVDQELELIRGLEKSRAASRSELITAETRANDTAGALKAAELALPRIRDAQREVRDKRMEKIAAFQGESLQKLANSKVELAALGQASRGTEDKIARTTIRAPTAGIVKTVSITTPGQVIQPGHNLVEIVPVNDSLLVEAQVRPQDIAFLRPGQPAMVKLSAYDFSIYGGLRATLEQIGADSITTDKGETYYLVRVRTERNSIQRGGDSLPIMPGMVADVDVITGSKSVLSYLTKPLVRVQQNALRER
jgi:membrane fusion protein, adhesin transport system